jgi:PPOX class probable F420-dependent enzyme
MSTIPESHQDLLHSKALAMLATVNPDGTPQVTPVWFDYDGQHIIFNTARGRQKDKNLGRNPQVALAIVDPANPYRYMQIRGVIDVATEEGADASIDRLAFKYLGKEKYPFGQPGEVRVLYKVRPERVQTMG